MNSHLTPQELVEAAESGLSSVRMAHVERCEACAGAVRELHSALGDVRTTAAIPEPSPLFWDHFSARVREATSAEPLPRTSWWGSLWRPVVAVAALAVVAVLGLNVISTPDLPPEVTTRASVDGPQEVVVPPTSPEETPGPAIAPASIDAPDAWESDPEALRAVTAVASRLGEDGLQTLALASGPALLDDLNSRELQEFARLLRAQMGGVK